MSEENENQKKESRSGYPTAVQLQGLEILSEHSQMFYSALNAKGQISAANTVADLLRRGYRLNVQQDLSTLRDPNGELTRFHWTLSYNFLPPTSEGE